ncbi:MAG: LysR family transcriptional regulator [Rhizobiales bacterium]|nr:LysR family transcriptional regulator [Hyphomicrobiales bacterium]OJY43474.1 MAG: LysR family transcriptional regulator [Rhizobiales bacterium 64-17]
MLDRVTGMQVFVRVVSLGSFSAAARSLGLSQTMVTKHITALEERLGVTLLHRTTRRLNLTEAGRRYLQSSERILAEIEEAETLAVADRVEPRGTLRINVPLAFGMREIAPILPRFAARHPKLTVDLGLADRMVDLIEERWDLAIRIGRMADSSLVARKLAPLRLMVCASPAYLQEHGTPKTVDDLRRHSCLGYMLSAATSADRWLFGKDGKMSVPISGRFRADNGDALRLAALEGLGLIYQPTFLLADDLRDGRLRAVTLDKPPVTFDGVFAVYPAERHPPAKVRACIDFLVEAFRGEPPWERDLPGA